MIKMNLTKINLIVNQCLDLVIRNYGKCKGPSKPCPERLRYVQKPAPVCGSDQQSYVNYEALICAQQRMKKSQFIKKHLNEVVNSLFILDLKFLHNGPCVQTT